MRQTLRLLAQVRRGQFLEANTPTGLTGLFTHPSPRPSLIVLYNQTLTKLKQLPEDSVYRQSAEAITKHRLKIIQDTKPAGYDAWLERIKKVAEQDPAAYEHLKQPDGTYAPRFFVGERKIEWDGEKRVSFNEGENTQQELERKFKAIEDAEKEAEEVRKSLEVEPPLDTEQISEIEHKIAAGLIEEVIQVAEGELKLVEEIIRSKAWENLEEKAPEGQWTYFERTP